MKLAVVGGGSTYTPELVAGLAREADRLDLRELVLQDIDAERREVVGGLAARMLGGGGLPGRAIDHGRPRPGRGRGVLRADPAARRRPGGPTVGRDDAPRVRVHRPGDDRRGRAGKGAPNGARRPRDRRARARAGGRRRLDRGFHQPRGDRRARAARRGPPGRRVVQRRHRLPALHRAHARRRSGPCADRPGRPQPPHLGARGSRRRGRRPTRPAGASTATSWPAQTGLPGDAARAARRDPFVLPPLLLLPRRRPRGAARRASRAPPRSRRSSASCSSSTATRR